MAGCRRRWGAEMLNLHKIWVEQCEAARGIENEFGTLPAMKYLVGEKFLNYLDAAEKDAGFRAELPAFVRRDQENLRAVADRRVPGESRLDGAIRPQLVRRSRRGL